MVHVPAKDDSYPSSPHELQQGGAEGNDMDHHHHPQAQRETMEGLRHAVEVQETHVRMLRARKAAREQLLSHIQTLLETGKALESHPSMEHVVQRAEESFQQLLQMEGATPTASTMAVGEVGEEEVVEPSDSDAAADPMARIFRSGVEAQLATVAEDPLPPPSASTALCFDLVEKKDRNAKAAKRRGRAQTRTSRCVGTVGAPAPSATRNNARSSAPFSMAAEALLAKSASRERAGTAAMLAALESLQLALQSNSSRTSTAPNDAGAKEPAWLLVDDEAEADAAQDKVQQEQQLLSSACCRRSPSVAASTEEYSDDFDACSEQSETGERREEHEAAAAAEQEGGKS
ncbi:hypothetical protein ABL78_2389 [Leptomonas seymouri]|uniref:Uncharacterized protein n=1 Tax=Leptomonas seymouri TaxID=5684 RepID=A0A0N1PEC2_LEPSE|nr:hypothetical protein ABL78_2389 [Leptomonas seymouri]|eukprot:KPI88493.1 hypothetical protein ABL78_2389 [Leptomonas seymouri]